MTRWCGRSSPKCICCRTWSAPPTAPTSGGCASSKLKMPISRPRCSANSSNCATQSWRATKRSAGSAWSWKTASARAVTAPVRTRRSGTMRCGTRLLPILNAALPDSRADASESNGNSRELVPRERRRDVALRPSDVKPSFAGKSRRSRPAYNGRTGRVFRYGSAELHSSMLAAGRRRSASALAERFDATRSCTMTAGSRTARAVAGSGQPRRRGAVSVDCVSHAAMSLVKRLCHQAGKPFVPLRSAGLAPFYAALKNPALGIAKG